MNSITMKDLTEQMKPTEIILKPQKIDPNNFRIKEHLKEALEEAKNNLYYDTSMALDIICQKLESEHGYNATFYKKSIFIDDNRVASIQTTKEAEKAIGIYKYFILI